MLEQRNLDVMRKIEEIEKKQQFLEIEPRTPFAASALPQQQDNHQLSQFNVLHWWYWMLM